MRTIFADAKIGAGDDGNDTGMVERRDEPANVLDPETAAVGETPFADAFGTI